MRLRAAPKRDVEAKPVSEEAPKASKRRTFMRSKYCRAGCTRADNNACSSCQAQEHWHRSVVGLVGRTVRG